MTEQKLSTYDSKIIELRELIWGKGFIAPGGEGNVDRVVLHLACGQ